MRRKYRGLCLFNLCFERCFNFFLCHICSIQNICMIFHIFIFSDFWFIYAKYWYPAEKA